MQLAATGSINTIIPPRRARAPVSPHYWSQIKRTVNGVPVSEAQIAMIIDAIRQGLSLQPNDVVCDIACGNGALSQYLFDDCAALFGSDIDPELIRTAREHFAAPPAYDFRCADAASYVRSEAEPQRYTKALCYGSFSYFSQDEAQEVLSTLHARFTNLQRVYIGNLPDRDRAHRFYPSKMDYLPQLNQPNTAIGLWRNAAEWRALAAKSGWQIRFHQMTEDFYAAHYRFDVVLDR
jgi:cyclopropane fatty-acyl-phospholipid synthase-like methyltransferase